MTPFTEIVVRRADQRKRTIDAESDLRTALLNAASEVSQLVGGVDVLRLEAIDLSNQTAVQNASPDQLTYSALVAAVLAQVVAASNNGTSALDDAITALITQTDNGQISTGDLRTLIGEAQAQLLGLGQSDRSGILATLRDAADEAERSSNGIFNPEPASGATSDAVTRAKNLVQTVRNTVQAQSDLDNPARSFADQVKTAHDPEGYSIPGQCRGERS